MLIDRPTICSAGAAQGVCPFHDGFIVPNHDCDVLGKGTITLVKDRALAVKLGANAGATVLDNFESWRTYQRIERIHNRLLGALPKATRQIKPAASATPEC